MDVTLREVGPRDGLQVEAPLDPQQRVALLEALVAAGLREIEVASFVSPRAVPAMAGGAEVLAAFGPAASLRRWALVPNLRGAQLALEAGADALTFIASASEAYSRNNVGKGIDDTVSVAVEVAAAVAGRVPLDAVVSCAFGSPYEGDIAPGAVADVAARLFEAGATMITLADTTGMASPPRVDAVLAAVRAALPPAVAEDVGLHLHETRGTGLVNAYAGLGAGVRRFDTALGGLGGSPFAPGAAGNLATEDFVYLLDELGAHTGVDLERLRAASRLLTGLVDHPLPSRVAAVGGRS